MAKIVCNYCHQTFDIGDIHICDNAGHYYDDDGNLRQVKLIIQSEWNDGTQKIG